MPKTKRRPVTEKSATSGTRSTPLRVDLHDAMLNLILEGHLPPGTRVMEARVARDLGVSRTPVREALLHLEREGFVRSELSLGFSVLPLRKVEVQEVYPILWTLEQLALDQSGPSIKLLTPELARINKQFAASSRTPAAASKADSAFHMLLISRCPNRKLLELAANLRKVIGRYERVYMAEPTLVESSVAQHAEIIAALDRDDLQAACAALKTNWRYGMDALLLRVESE